MGGENEENWEQELAKWWRTKTEEEIVKVIPKVKEYGSADLRLIGDALGALISKKPRGGEWTAAERQEIGISFYVLGKIARSFGAYHQGKLPSLDTLADLRIYVMMMTRIREVGGWPHG